MGALVGTFNQEKALVGESMFDKNDSIYKVSMPQSFYELNSSTSKHDDNDTLSDSTKDKSKVENIAKVESWLSKESSNLMSFSFKQARGLLMLQLVYLNKLCLYQVTCYGKQKIKV